MLISLEGAHAFYVSIFGEVEHLRNFNAFRRRSGAMRSGALQRRQQGVSIFALASVMRQQSEFLWDTNGVSDDFTYNHPGPNHSARRDPIDAFCADADDHGKNIIHGLDMSGTMRSSPGAVSSSFMSKSESQIAQQL